MTTISIRYALQLMQLVIFPAALILTCSVRSMKRLCDFTENDQGYRQLAAEIDVTCNRCGRTLADIGTLPVRISCHGPPGLGDMLHRILKRAGFNRRHGCGCKQRQRSLNRLGWRILRRCRKGVLR